MPYSESQKKATIKWMASNYDRIHLTVPKGMKQRINEAAKRQGYPSARAFIIEVLEEAMKGEQK